MTVTEAVTYCRNLHNALNDTNWSDTEIYALLQAACMEAVSTLGLIEAQTTTTSVSGTQTINFPTDYIRIRRIRYNAIGLKYINFRQYEARVPLGTTPNGTPREWTQWNNVIYMLPIPANNGDTIYIFGEKQQSAITSSSSTLDIPTVFHPAVCDKVIGEMFAKDLNANMARMYLERWTGSHLPSMKTFAKQRRRVGAPTVVTDADTALETDFGII